MKQVVKKFSIKSHSDNLQKLLKNIPMKKIKISVLIANYNGEKYLIDVSASCIKQNIKKNYEIIFIDDNSTDNSLDKIKKFKRES